MSRRKRLLSIAGLLALVATPGPARGEDMTGTWIAVHGLMGDVIGHIEELTVADDGAAVVNIYKVPIDQPCIAPGRLGRPECISAADYVGGRIAVDSSARKLILKGALSGKAALPGIDGVLGQIYWLAPDIEYFLFRKDRILDISAAPANAPDGAPHPALRLPPTKRFVRAEPGLAAALIIYAQLAEEPVIDLACVLPLAAETEDGFAKFRALVIDGERLGRFLDATEARAEAGESIAAKGAAREQLREITGLASDDPGYAAKRLRQAALIGISRANLELYLRPKAANLPAGLPLPPGLPKLRDIAECRSSLRR
ncbi:MAG TPA: hypothetical protein PK264_14075 [Hyphomicrobiaceae bacterium]|nr:hypothetical protein [Hyphomicrobiaceae bacterium]